MINIKKTKKEYPLGKTTPYAWVIELVHGCNLRCGHCACRLFPRNKYHFMEEDVWSASWKVLAEVSPTVRVDFALMGEPTLHPKILKFLSIARDIAPKAQIQITTNGTMLRNGKLTYSQLLNSGANIIYTDMYGSENNFTTLAKKSGFYFYEYYKKPEKALSPWSYYGPDLKMIVLQQQPENWPKSRFRAGLLGGWMNHLDWKAAIKFGLKPVTVPISRRCNQPFVYVSVASSGKYLLCCQDGFEETDNLFGSVLDGQKGFLKYWYGKRMMDIRLQLRNKNRAGNPFCSRCNITFSRCDYIHWKHSSLQKYWDGKKWRK